MKPHSLRVKHHLIVDVLGNIAGGALVAAVTLHWTWSLLALAAMILQYIVDRANIEEDELLPSPAPDWKDAFIGKTKAILAVALQHKISDEDAKQYDNKSFFAGSMHGTYVVAEQLVEILKETRNAENNSGK